jgi:copper chaperone
MNKYQFKTNITCCGCVAKVTPHLNEAEQIKNWKVETANPNRLLSVEAERLDESLIKRLMGKAGFKAGSL